MHIFIDESGSFTIPKGATAPAVSCVGAVVMPSADADAIQADFAALAAPWADASGEVKGRSLNEQQIDAFLAFLVERKCLIAATAIDLGLHRVAEVAAHRDAQSRKLTANLTDKHHPDAKAFLHDLATRLRALKTPNYVQLFITTILVDAVMRDCVLYIVQRRPADLGIIDWTLDAKGSSITEMEELWRFLVKPFLQSSALENPIALADWCDYSAFDAAFQSEKEGVPDFLIPHAKPSPRRRERTIDIGRVLERLRFASSAETVGLQMADIAVNTIRRMLIGNLAPAGWRRLASVMTSPAVGNEIVQMLTMQTRRRWHRAPYAEPLHVLKGIALPMLAR